MVRSSFVLVAVLLGLTISCERSPEVSPQNPAPSARSTNQQVFQVKGVVVSVNPRRKQVEIKHEEIRGYMPAMTMPFDVRNTNELAGLEPGQAISFRMTVTDTEGWIDQIQRLQPASTNGPPPGASLNPVRNVEPLGPGDRLPDYSLTNQFGQVFSTALFKGQALAITFLFTRCPYPTFCPRMSTNFEETQQKLSARSGSISNWQLLTVSFDPDFDKPAVLRAYADSHQCDPAHWTFATGALIDVTALGEQFGLVFVRDPSSTISHNLRTAVIDPAGRVQKIFQGNTWTSDELVAEMLKAAQAR
jgi:protein SCO1/2